MLCDLGKLDALGVIENLAVIAFTRNIDAENDGLINHLIKVNSGADILGHLGFGVNEEIPGNMHEFDEGREVIFYGGMVHDDEPRAVLRADALLRVVEAREGAHRARG